MLCFVVDNEDGKIEKLAHSALVLSFFIPRGVASRDSHRHIPSYC